MKLDGYWMSYNLKTIVSLERRYNTKITSDHVTKLTKLMVKYNLDKKLLDKLILILRFFNLDYALWIVHSKSQLRDFNQQVKDYKEFYKLNNSLRDGTKSFKVGRHSFTSNLFKSMFSAWVVEHWEFLSGKFSKGRLDIESFKPITKPLGFRSHIIDHADMFLFRCYLKNGKFISGNRDCKFIEEFLKIALPDVPSSKKICEGLNKKGKHLAYIPFHGFVNK